MKTIGQVTLFTVYIILSALWSGYVLSILWVWFIVSQFPMMPRLSVAAAIGIAITVRYLTTETKIKDDEKQLPFDERVIRMVVLSFGAPAIALAIGWIVHLFV